MLCVPTASVEIVHVAFAAATATAPHPPRVVPPSAKPIVPVGDTPPEIVAVNVTLVPNVDGVSDVVTAVVVGLRPVGSANRNRCADPSVVYTAPFATIRLCQCVPPSGDRLHSAVAIDRVARAHGVAAHVEEDVVGDDGEVPPVPLFHCNDSDGLLAPS